MSEEHQTMYRSLFRQIDIEVLAFFGAKEDVEKLMCSHKAKLNVIVNSKALVNVARQFENQWNVPFVEVSFCGVQSTSDALRVIAEHFNDGLMCRQTQLLILKNEQVIEEMIRVHQKSFLNKTAVVLLHGMSSWAYLSFLETLGLNIVAVSIENISDVDKEKAVDLFLGKGRFLYDTKSEFEEITKENIVDIVLTHSDYISLITQAKVPFFNFDACEQSIFMGYEGALLLLKNLLITLNTPVFKYAYAKAPWDNSF